jgi:hypothetical protein
LIVTSLFAVGDAGVVVLATSFNGVRRTVAGGGRQLVDHEVDRRARIAQHLAAGNRRGHEHHESEESSQALHTGHPLLISL